MISLPPLNDDFTSELNYFRQSGARSQQKLYSFTSPPPSPIRLPLDLEAERNLRMTPAVLPSVDLAQREESEDSEESEESKEDSEDDLYEDEQEEEVCFGFFFLLVRCADSFV